MQLKSKIELRQGLLRARLLDSDLDDLLLIGLIYTPIPLGWQLKYPVPHWFAPYINLTLSAPRVTEMLLTQRFDPIARGVTIEEFIERFRQGPPW